MSTKNSTILIVEDDEAYRESLQFALKKNYTLLPAGSVSEAQSKLGEPFDLALIDVRLSEDEPDTHHGLTLLESLHTTRPDLPVVMMTAYADIDLAVQAMRMGAADFVQKADVDPREFRKVIDNAFERAQMKRKLSSLEDQYRLLEPWEMVGDSPAIQDLRKTIDMVAQDGHTRVLIRGETGTGKELVARAVHSRGWRKDAPFVPVSLPALPRELIDAELFGHVEGAFTDARKARVGYIEKANGGVLFLDEIGDLPMELQSKLLRVLEEGSFAPVGTTNEISVDIQVVAATNCDLEAAIEAKTFREDLYYRLNAVEVEVPPLRKRSDDVPLLVDHFLFLFRQQGRTTLAGITPAALERLRRYRFPGNIRELKTIVERAMMLATSLHQGLIEESDLPQDLRDASSEPSPPPAPCLPDDGVELDRELARLELAYVEEALRKAEGRKTDAWQYLGLNDRFALLRRVKSIGDNWPQLKSEYPLVSKLYYE